MIDDEVDRDDLMSPRERADAEIAEYLKDKTFAAEEGRVHRCKRCKIEGVNAPRVVFARGLCSRHYARQRYEENAPQREAAKKERKRQARIKRENERIQRKLTGRATPTPSSMARQEVFDKMKLLEDFSKEDFDAFAQVAIYGYCRLINATNEHHKLAQLGLLVFHMLWIEDLSQEEIDANEDTRRAGRGGERVADIGTGVEHPVYVLTPIASKVIVQCVGTGRIRGGPRKPNWLTY